MPSPTPTQSDVRFDFKGKRALITGASRGIGRMLALGFGQSGADLILTARETGPLEIAAEELRAQGSKVDCIAVDQRDIKAVRERLSDLPAIDILINNAGIEQVCPSLDVDEALWDRIVDTNLKGAFFVAQTAAANMAANGGGAIVNLASLTSYVGVPTATPYGASKSGVLGMTRALASEWAALNIRVNAIAPGYFHTDLTHMFYEDPAWVADMESKVPMGRLGKLEDLTGAVQFLASGASEYITGQCIVIDGGYLAKI